MLPVAVINPAVPKLPTLALPDTLEVVPLKLPTNVAAAMLPTLALPETDSDVNVPTAVTCVCEALTLNVVPVRVNPVPAAYVPAPEN